MKPISQYTTLLVAVLGLGLAAATAQEESRPSPFSSPQNRPAGPDPAAEAPTALDSFEFNGIMKMGGVLRVSVYDSKANRNYWLRLDEATEDGLRVQRYDEKTQSVVLGRGGVSKKLTFKETRIEPLRVAAAPTAAQPPPGVSVANPGPAVAQESDEEVRERMQRVAEEIRRRRAERRQRLEGGQ